jgi:hypothetical protein
MIAVPPVMEDLITVCRRVVVLLLDLDAALERNPMLPEHADLQSRIFHAGVELVTVLQELEARLGRVPFDPLAGRAPRLEPRKPRLPGTGPVVIL